MTKREPDPAESIDRKLSVVISILLKIVEGGKEATLKDQIGMLSSFGLATAEIADILGRKVSHVSKELSNLRKGR